MSMYEERKDTLAEVFADTFSHEPEKFTAMKELSYWVVKWIFGIWVT